MKNRITLDNITKLEPNEIFVFGSNTAGIHGKGAALQAVKFGAKHSIGYGFMGRCFAIPTKNGDLKTLPLNTISDFVNYFIQDIKNYKHKIFLVTEIGCGLTGYKHKDIAPMFKAAKDIENIYLPLKFWNEL